MHVVYATVLLSLLSSNPLAFPKFRDAIPNAKNVPNVNAIGHKNGVEGGGALTSFGNDFRANDYKWTKELCEKDSDGDGQMNGQELGDPCCKWSMDTNMVLAYTKGVSHPGDKTKKADPTLWKSIECNAVANASLSPTPTPSQSVKDNSTRSDDKEEQNDQASPPEDVVKKSVSGVATITMPLSAIVLSIAPLFF